MRFRRTRFRRRQRHGANLVPLTLCSQTVFLSNGLACTEPNIEIIPLSPLFGSESPGEPTGDAQRLLDQTVRKELLIQGMRFHWAVYPASVVAELAQFFVSFRLAIIKMEVDGAGTPSFLPNLYSPAQVDMGDVLWRGAGIIAFPTANSPGPFNCPDACASDWYSGAGNITATGSMSREGSHSQMEVVKTKRRLGPNDRIFLVVNAHNPLDVESPADVRLGLEFFGFAAVRSIQR